MLLMIITLERWGGIGMKEKLFAHYIHSDTFGNVLIYGWVDTMVVGI